MVPCISEGGFELISSIKDDPRDEENKGVTMATKFAASIIFMVYLHEKHKN